MTIHRLVIKAQILGPIIKTPIHRTIIKTSIHRPNTKIQAHHQNTNPQAHHQKTNLKVHCQNTNQQTHHQNTNPQTHHQNTNPQAHHMLKPNPEMVTISFSKRESPNNSLRVHGILCSSDFLKKTIFKTERGEKKKNYETSTSQIHGSGLSRLYKTYQHKTVYTRRFYLKFDFLFIRANINSLRERIK